MAFATAFSDGDASCVDRLALLALLDRLGGKTSGTTAPSHADLCMRIRLNRGGTSHATGPRIVKRLAQQKRIESRMAWPGERLPSGQIAKRMTSLHTVLPVGEASPSPQVPAWNDPRLALVDVRLRPASRAILAVLLLHTPEESGQCWPGYERLARMAGVHESTVARALAELADRQLLSWVKKAPGTALPDGQITASWRNVYTLNLAALCKLAGVPCAAPPVLMPGEVVQAVKAVAERERIDRAAAAKLLAEYEQSLQVTHWGRAKSKATSLILARLSTHTPGEFRAVIAHIAQDSWRMADPGRRLVTTICRTEASFAAVLAAAEKGSSTLDPKQVDLEIRKADRELAARPPPPPPVTVEQTFGRRLPDFMKPKAPQ